MSNEHDATPEADKPAAAPEAAPEPKHGPKHHKHEHDKHKRHAARRVMLVGAGVALLAVGVGVGATAYSFARPAAEMAPLVPVAISAMPADSLVTIKGNVAEIFGNKFILQDNSGRALVETGRAGEGGRLVKASEPITVQGRFEDGFLRARFIVRENGKTEAIGGGKEGGPKRDRDRDRGPKHGPRNRDDRRGGPDGPRAEAPAPGSLDTPAATPPAPPPPPAAPNAPAGERTPL